MRYIFDAARSRFNVQAFATGVLSGFGHNPVFAIRNFSGEMRLDPQSTVNAAFEMTVRAESLELNDQIKEADRQEITRALREDVLHTSKYPQIGFRSTQIALTTIAENWSRAQIQGEMALHGTTQPQQIDAQVRILEGELRLNGEFVLLQSSFKIKRISALAGMIKVRDELKFTFDLVCVTQEQLAP